MHLRCGVSMTTVAERLVGSQIPRVQSAPPAMVSLGVECVEFAAQAGLHLDPWQQTVLIDSMGVASGGKWSAPQVGLLVPRQNGKGSVLEARELFGMFVLDEELIIHSAHKFDTSQEHFLRMRNLIDGNADLSRHVQAVSTANGKEAIVLKNGNRLKFKARTISGSGRGFSSDLLILDEAMLLPEQALDAMLPTLITRRNPQTWFTSSAGMASSAALWRIVKRGRAGAPRMAYFEWGCEQDADCNDRANWAAANPGLGISDEHGIQMEALEDDLAQMTAEGFAREHLGIWDDLRDDAAIPVDVWLGLADPGTPPPSAPVFAVATAPDRSWSAIGAAWRRPDGLTQVILSDYQPGASWVKPRVDELRARYGCRILVDTASRGLLADVVEPSMAEQAQAHNALSDAVLAGQLRHGNEPALNTAVRAARWRPSGDTRILERKGSADISPLVAAALAMSGVSFDVLGAIF